MKQIPITTPDELGSDLEVSLSIKQHKPQVECQRGSFKLVMSLTQQEFETFDFEKRNPIPEISLDSSDFIFTPINILNKIEILQGQFRKTGSVGGILIWKKIK